jgi:hypothetical protein
MCAECRTPPRYVTFQEAEAHTSVRGLGNVSGAQNQFHATVGQYPLGSRSASGKSSGIDTRVSLHPYNEQKCCELQLHVLASQVL